MAAADLGQHRNALQAMTLPGRLVTWPLNEFHIVTESMIDLGQLIGHGNWGDIRHGFIRLDGKKNEVAVKQPRGEPSLTKPLQIRMSINHLSASFLLEALCTCVALS